MFLAGNWRAVNGTHGHRDCMPLSGVEPMTARACLDCGDVTRTTRCPSCQSKRNVARGSSAKRGYGRRHRGLAARYLRLHPWCELHFRGCQRAAADADHIVPIRPSAGGKSVWANYQAACRPCHARKTREDAKRYPIHA